MNDWIKKLASLKLTVTLLVLLLVALAAGTVVESSQGTDAAGRLVYYSLWFRVLLLAMGVNTLFAIAVRWPPNNYRIGFLVTHTALLVILAGALVSARFKVEGQLALWEGQESPVFALRTDSPTGAQATLPFSVRLDAFEIDYYPGTHRPAMFRSRVTVTDPELGGSFPAVIEMNRELSYRGYKLFQSSYQQAGGREMSVLSVSHDPGQLIVFIGYFLLLGGMSTVLGTRIVQARALARRQSERPGVRGAVAARRPGRKAAAAGVASSLIAALGLAAGGALAAPTAARAAGPLPAPEVVEALRSLPVQHDGRVMPLDTVAREGVWKVTGERGGWQGADPVAVVLSWMFDGRAWVDEPVVELGGSALAVAAGLPPGTTHASYSQLFSSPGIHDLLSQARSRRQRGEEHLPPQLAAAWKLDERLGWLQSFLTRDLLRVAPASADPVALWNEPPASVTDAASLLAWYRQTEAQPPAGYPSSKEMTREVTYNRVHPTRLAWWVLALGTVLSLLALRRPSRLWDLVAVAALVTGVGVMTWGLAVRWQIEGHIPASNMYESMLFLAWGVGLFALLAAALLRNRLVIFNAAAMAALTLGLASFLPIDPFIHPIAPVLSGTPWLAIHVPIIMVSYSVLALGVLIAHLQIGIEIFRPKRREAAARMNGLLYWYMHVGALLLVAGIITGSIWAASSWGRYWGWDPKEVWSLIAFIAYMGILHSRFDRQMGAFGVAAASIVAFWAILMTYIGVNFVLTAGLHSYGFGSGGVVEWMAGIGVLEILFLGTGYLAHRRNTTAHGPLVAAGI